MKKIKNAVYFFFFLFFGMPTDTQQQMPERGLDGPNAAANKR
jgi:hypothetical protein